MIHEFKRVPIRMSIGTIREKIKNGNYYSKEVLTVAYEHYINSREEHFGEIGNPNVEGMTCNEISIRMETIDDIDVAVLYKNIEIVGDNVLADVIPITDEAVEILNNNYHFSFRSSVRVENNSNIPSIVSGMLIYHIDLIPGKDIVVESKMHF